MRNLLIVAATLFSMTALADTITTAFTTSVESQAEIAEVIAAINSGRIRVPGCGLNSQKVYAFNFNENSGSFVVKADGSFRPVGSKATFKVSCRD